MPSILVADDDPQQLLLRRALLETAGHEVRIALTASDVQRQLTAAAPDLLVMDLKFPNAEGESDAEEGLALIRQVHHQMPSLPVIVLSGWPEVLDGRPEETWIRRVILKPCRMEALLGAVRDVLMAGLCALILRAGPVAVLLQWRA
jgi:CheY-like chemotaxis protein